LTAATHPRAARAAAVCATAVLALLSAGCGAGDRAEPFAADTVLPGAPDAPDFALRDAAGRTVRLADFRGRAVLVTFLYVGCPDVCPLIVGNLHAALERLGSRAGRAHVVAVSVDPQGDTAAAVRAFVRRHDMEGRMTYLVGSQRDLAPVWRAYGVGVQGPPEARSVGHTAAIYGIGASGRKLVYYPQNFSIDDVAHDIPLLAEQ